MANRIFLDTNIIFDVIDVTRPNSDRVKEMFSLFKKRDFSMFISAITINNIVYVMRNKFHMDTSVLKKKLNILLQLFQVVPFDLEILTNGLKLSFEDIEDSFQFISALRCKANYLITEDKEFLQKCPDSDKIKIINTKDFIITENAQFKSC
jgi:predicted nucleic acid-binding protein